MRTAVSLVVCNVAMFSVGAVYDRPFSAEFEKNARS
jgi:hypothetical protein